MNSTQVHRVRSGASVLCQLALVPTAVSNRGTITRRIDLHVFLRESRALQKLTLFQHLYLLLLIIFIRPVLRILK
jgi:hypothetical protein